MKENKDSIKEITELANKKDFFSLKNKLLAFNEEHKDHYYFNMLGYANQELGDLEEAEKNYTRSLDLDNNFLEAKFI